MKVYTKTEYDRLDRETLCYEQIETNIRGFDIVETSKSQWDEEKYYYADLSSGIRLEIFDSQILLDSNQLTEHAERQYFTTKFYLSGDHNIICPGIHGIAAEYSETKGQNYLFYLPNIDEIEQYSAGDRLQILKIMVDLDTIRKFITQFNTVPKQLQRLIEKEKPQRFHSTVGDVTLQMQTIVRQIWQHPYQDAIARMYLEGKVLELLAMQLAQLTEQKTDAIETTLKPRNIDRIYQARDILVTCLENPPLISELAQQVELSESTLRRGFKKLFNTTIIGYLTL